MLRGSQTEVWRHPGLKKAQISLWANGRRPMSLRPRERYCQLLRDLDQVNPRPNAEALCGARLPPVATSDDES